MEQELIRLTQAEMKKVLVVQRVLDGRMTNKEGAIALGLTERHVIRLKKKYLIGGPQELAHKNRGSKPAHALPDALKDQVTQLYQTKYHGSNNCHYAELLLEHEAINISPSSVRRILFDKGIKHTTQRRRNKVHQPRQRKPQAGMLWQIDATSFAWLEDRSPVFSLHAAIDDATGIVVGAVFRPTECREGYSLVMQQGIKKFGVPLGLYSDRHTIFRSPNEKLSIEQDLAGETKPLSHFGKAMLELHIELIKAITPQAKGRIERLWRTFQDRLVIELRLLGVSTLEDANKVLPSLLQKHNRRFAVKPKDSESAYGMFDPSINLAHVFTIRKYRILGQGHTLSYNGKVYTFAKPSNSRFEAKMTVEVRETLSGEVVLWHNGQAIALKETQKTIRLQQTTKKAVPAQPCKPADTHPWKMSFKSYIHNKITTKSDALQVT